MVEPEVSSAYLLRTTITKESAKISLGSDLSTVTSAVSSAESSMTPAPSLSMVETPKANALRLVIEMNLIVLKRKMRA